MTVKNWHIMMPNVIMASFFSMAKKGIASNTLRKFSQCASVTQNTGGSPQRLPEAFEGRQKHPVKRSEEYGEEQQIDYYPACPPEHFPDIRRLRSHQASPP
jgi:hypothetical protein